MSVCMFLLMLIGDKARVVEQNGGGKRFSFQVVFRWLTNDDEDRKTIPTGRGRDIPFDGCWAVNQWPPTFEAKARTDDYYDG